MKRALALLLTLVLAMTSLASVAAQNGSSTDPVDPIEGCEYFEETGHNLCDVFLDFWNDNGGLPIFGYPITEAFDEENWDTGEIYEVQYFERERLEHHTDLAGTDYEVLLGRLGNEVLLQQGRNWLDFEKSDPSEDNYIAVTGFAVPEVFMTYWRAHGLDLGDPGISFRESLALFGYPISQAQMETNASGDTVMTQWFERARFEHHPDNAEEHQVLLGLLGSELLGFESEVPIDPEPEPVLVLTLVTDDVNQPRHISVGADGALYVANAGLGGDECVELEFPDEPNGENGNGNGDDEDDANGNGNGDDEDDTNGNGNGNGDDEDDTNGNGNGNGDDEDDTNGNGNGNGDDEDDTNGNGNGNGDDEDDTNGNGNGDDVETATLCFGTSGSITRIADGEGETFIAGIPSFNFDDEGVGLHSVVVTEEGDVYGVMGWGFGFTPEIRTAIGESAEFFGHLVKIDEDGSLTSIADILEYEAANDPDGNGVDANPYAMIWDDDAFIVVDAGMNALLRITMDGEIEVVAVFPPQMVPAPPFIPADEMPSESVPTHVVVGPDGNYYVSELTGFPFHPGSARIWQVTPDGDAEVVEEGFTNVGALAFDSEGNLYVLEMVAGGLLNADPGNPATAAASLTKIHEDGTRETVAGLQQGMIFATGMAIDGNGDIYIVNLAVIPGFSHVGRLDWVHPE